MENGSFETVRNKDTRKDAEVGDYKGITKKWVNKNDTFRNMKDRKALEDRFKLFLQSLRSFDDRNTESGTIKDQEKYHLLRWAEYKDLEKKVLNLPKASTKRKDARKYMEEQAKKNKNK